MRKAAQAFGRSRRFIILVGCQEKSFTFVRGRGKDSYQQMIELLSAKMQIMYCTDNCNKLLPVMAREFTASVFNLKSSLLDYDFSFQD